MRTGLSRIGTDDSPAIDAASGGKTGEASGAVNGVLEAAGGPTL